MSSLPNNIRVFGLLNSAPPIPVTPPPHYLCTQSQERPLGEAGVE